MVSKVGQATANPATFLDPVFCMRQNLSEMI